jgi:hypothetical protein
MREFNQFSVKEWLQFLPLQLAFKQIRNDLWLAFYKRMKPKNLDLFLQETEKLKGHNIALVVAFEQPWALDWLLRMAARNLTDTTVLVFDNSRRSGARTEIEEMCRKHKTPYLALPSNPTKHVNRSHGMAMTWIFYNVVRAIQPRLFAFIDHDLIPVAKVSFSGRIGKQPFFGMERHAGSWAWNIWAGYCVFDFQHVALLPMNFLYDFSRGLDTGGRNWSCLYQNFDQSDLRFAACGSVDVRESLRGTSRTIQFVDDCWLHIGGISYNDNFRSKAEFCNNLAQSLENGAEWEELRDAPLTAKTKPEDADKK